MKIIGTTSGGYLVEATSDELIRISGRDDRVHRMMGNDWRPNRDAVGMDFNVAGAWDRLRELRDKEESMRRSAASLRALADLIDGKLDFVKERGPVPAAKVEGEAQA